MDLEEFKVLVRKKLKIHPTELSDKHLRLLVRALDDDGNMMISMKELSDFSPNGWYPTGLNDADGLRAGPLESSPGRFPLVLAHAGVRTPPRI